MSMTSVSSRKSRPYATAKGSEQTMTLSMHPEAASIMFALPSTLASAGAPMTA